MSTPATPADRNEPSADYQWTIPAHTDWAPGYAKLLKASYRAIKESDPSAQVVIAGLNDGTQPDPCPDLGQALPGVTFLWGDVDCQFGLNPLDALYVLAYKAGIVLSHSGCPAIGSPLT